MGLPASGGRGSTKVTDFGAAGDGNTDDSRAIQDAIAHSPPGGVVSFAPGTYRIGKILVLLSGREYHGEPGAVLQGAGDIFLAQTERNNTHDVRIEGLTFDGAGIVLLGPDTPGRGVHVARCTFRNIVNANRDYVLHSAIYIPGGLTDSSIRSSRFANILEGGLSDPRDRSSNGILAWRISRFAIEGNTFDTVNQGISVQFDKPGPYPGIVIDRNVFVRIHRMGIELQGQGTTGLRIENNRFSDFLNPFLNSFGISLAVDRGTDSVVRGNEVVGLPAPAPGQRYGYGIEVSGQSAIVEDNTIRGMFDAGVAIGHAPAVTVCRNSLCGWEKMTPVLHEKGSPRAPDAAVLGNVRDSLCLGSRWPGVSVEVESPRIGSVLDRDAVFEARVRGGRPASVRFELENGTAVPASGGRESRARLETASLPDGPHAVVAVARDSEGRFAISPVIRFYVRNRDAGRGRGVER